MKRALAVIFALAATSVFADEVKKTEIKTETKTGKKGDTTTVEAKTTTDPAGLMNSTTDSAKTTQTTERNADGTMNAKTEKVVEHDAPGMKNDTKSKVLKTVKTDSNGNIIKEDVKADMKK